MHIFPIELIKCFFFAPNKSAMFLTNIDLKTLFPIDIEHLNGMPHPYSFKNSILFIFTGLISINILIDIKLKFISHLISYWKENNSQVPERQQSHKPFYE